MRHYHRDANRAEAEINSATHLAIAHQQHQDSHVPTIIDYTLRFASEAEMIQLTPTERTAIESQDRIGWNHFIRGRTTK